MLINSQTNLNKVAPTPTPNTNGNRNISFAQNHDTVEFSTKEEKQEKSSLQKYGIPILGVAAIVTAAILTKGKLWGKTAAKDATKDAVKVTDSEVSKVETEAEKLAKKKQQRMLAISQKYIERGNKFAEMSDKLYEKHDAQHIEYNAKAIRAFGKAIEFDRQNPKILCQRGILFEQVGETKKAEMHYREAIRISPEFAPAYCNMAKVLVNEQPEVAFYYLDRGSLLDPLDGDFPALKEKMIADLKKQGKEIVFAKVNGKQTLPPKELAELKAKEKKLQEKIRKNPQQFRLYSEIAIVLGKQERYEDAIKALHSAIAIRPDFADGYVELGRMYKNLKMHDKAIESYDRAIELNPIHSIAHYNKSIAYMETGKPHSALESINSAIRINPNDADFYPIRMFLLDSMGKTEDCSVDILTQKRITKK